ncbi:alkaline phosphatase family protein [Glycocaulis sp.]
MRILHCLAASLAALALAACATQQPTGTHSLHQASHPAAEAPLVVLFAVDGLRWDSLELYDVPNMQALARRGMQPQALIPVTPTSTFVQFYSMATGLHPEDHGILNNATWDAELQERFTNPASQRDPRWWHGEPFWITAERQGIRTAIQFWLGSENSFDGDRASRWFPYHHVMPYEDRVAAAMTWLDGPEEIRPQLIALYFDEPDSSGHRYGPDSDGYGAAIARVDEMLGLMIDELDARGLLERTDIVFLSDHGMAELSTERVISIDEAFDISTVFIPEVHGMWGNSYQPYMNVYGEPDAIEAAYAAMDGLHPNMRVWRRGEMPEHIRIDHPTRGPDLLVMADAGWMLTSSQLPQPQRSLMRGTHGYDANDPSMHAVIIGAGPSFPAGEQTDPVRHLDIYLLVSCLLGFDPVETEGDAEAVSRFTGGRCEVD